MRRATTMQDIANHVGVSRMTVSVALHGTSSTVGVSAATRERIMEAARLLSYRPNAVARSLRTRQTNVIGLYSGYGALDPRNSFLAQIVAGLGEGCAGFGKDLLLHTSFGGNSTEEIFSELVDGRIDGLIIFSPPEDPLVEKLAGSHMPVVGVADAIAALPTVLVDDTSAARLTFQYLAERGHRRILYRTLDERLVSAERRAAAYLSAAREQGLAVEAWRAPGHVDLEHPYLRGLLETPRRERPTAVVCWNDVSAFELLSHCRRAGVRVPDDLAIVGFDGDHHPLACLCRLTTVRAPWAEVASTAVRLLIDRMNGKYVPSETTLPVEFVAGDTA